MSRKEDRRIDAKKDRAAVRQSLGGGHPTQPQHMHWGSKAEPVPVLDETPRRSGRPRKGCPKRKGGKHVPIRTSYTQFASTYARVICKYCGKHKWGRSRDWEELPELASFTPSNDHWAYHNIVARLGNGFCDCPTCERNLDNATNPSTIEP